MISHGAARPLVFVRVDASLSIPILHSNRVGLMMNTYIKSLFAAVAVTALLVVYVIVEVVVAMLAYMYLALSHVETFGHLVSLSRDVLNLFANQLEQFSPELANRAYTTLLGELGPKSILLLLIGLTVSALGRLTAWILRRWYTRLRSV